MKSRVTAVSDIAYLPCQLDTPPGGAIPVMISFRFFIFFIRVFWWGNSQLCQVSAAFVIISGKRPCRRLVFGVISRSEKCFETFLSPFFWCVIHVHLICAYTLPT